MAATNVRVTAPAAAAALADDVVEPPQKTARVASKVRAVLGTMVSFGKMPLANYTKCSIYCTHAHSLCRRFNGLELHVSAINLCVRKCSKLLLPKSLISKLTQLIFTRFGEFIQTLCSHTNTSFTTVSCQLFWLRGFCYNMCDDISAKYREENLRK